MPEKMFEDRKKKKKFKEKLTCKNIRKEKKKRR